MTLYPVLMQKVASLRLIHKLGPPNQWSGGVAAAMGPETRAKIQKTWASLNAEQHRRALETFKRKFRSC